MKKALCMIALGAISFGSAFAYGNPVAVKSATMQTDTTKKMKKKHGKMKTKKTVKKDTSATPVTPAN